MNRKLTMGSLFDGSGGFPLGGLMSGVTPVWASEIEPFPIRVTSKRLPYMKHYGDISQMDGGKIEPVDIITFGSPCTDMSVSGRRAGLEGQQSVLFYQAIRIIKEMRCATNGKYPRYIVWENVPGAFSSNSGEDFKAVLEAVIGVAEPETQVPMPEKNRWPYADCYMGDGWSVAYRTLDSQHWGLPQRRKRIFLVGDLAGQCAADVLFKSEGLSGYSAEGFRTWQRAAGSIANCSGATGFDGYNGELTGSVSSTLGVNCGMSTGRNGIVLSSVFMKLGLLVPMTLSVLVFHELPTWTQITGFCIALIAIVLINAKKEKKGAVLGNIFGKPEEPKQPEVSEEAQKEAENQNNSTREKFRTMLRDGLLEDREVELTIQRQRNAPSMEIIAGGSLEDLEEFRQACQSKLDFTIGSALDLFGGKVPYDVVAQL